jgi:hypothetical protein
MHVRKLVVLLIVLVMLLGATVSFAQDEPVTL